MAVSIPKNSCTRCKERVRHEPSATHVVTVTRGRYAGIQLSPSTLAEFMTFMTSSSHSHAITFPEFRDFLLLMPRKASPKEIFRYYEVRKVASDEARGAARVNMEGESPAPIEKAEYAETKSTAGDVTLSAEDMSVARAAAQQHPASPATTDTPLEDTLDLYDEDEVEEEEEFEEEDQHSWFEGSTAVKFLAAGGVAGAGKSQEFSGPRWVTHAYSSVTNMYRTVRSTEDLPHHAAARPGRCLTELESTRPGRAGYWKRRRSNILRGRRARFLDREWALGSEDSPRVGHQVPGLRILRTSHLSGYLTAAHTCRYRNGCSQSTGIMLTTQETSAASVGSYPEA